jgi:hypothetical protein
VKPLIFHRKRNFFFLFKNKPSSWAPVAHTCNPRYSGGRDQEDHGLKPARANSSPDPILKKTHYKKGWWSGVAQGIISSNPSTAKKPKKTPLPPPKTTPKKPFIATKLGG